MTLTIFYDIRDREGEILLHHLREKGNGSSINRVFHDLNQDDLEPCCGCFSCWIKTPGVCIYKDKGAQFLKEIVQSDRILFLFPLTWGGCSSKVKILMDRSLGRVLPFFITRKGETHHPERYESEVLFSFAGYGSDIDQAEEELFLKNVNNFSDNMGGGLNSMVIRREEDLAELDVFLGETE